jgi:hypothetical protein
MEHLDTVLNLAEVFMEQSELARKMFHPLHPTRKGKLQPGTLAMDERKGLKLVVH